jgi:hypothetical protein
VEGWHEGVEWINTGALVDRVNFAANRMSNVESPGVRAIIDRLANQNGGHFTPELLVDRCLDLMGPMTVSEETRTALVENLAPDGELSLEGHERGDASEKVVGKVLGLISSTREYPLA